MTVTVVGLFLLLLTISCRNSQIDKQFNQIQDQKKQLAALQKENEQLKAENQTLREKLQKAYDFMKQFTISGINLLERFLESVGERVQNFTEHLRR